MIYSSNAEKKNIWEPSLEKKWMSGIKMYKIILTEKMERGIFFQVSDDQGYPIQLIGERFRTE